MSLKQFIGLCARAQLLQSSEEGPYGKAGRSKGLSMTEVRALVDVFDSVDQRPGGRIGAVPHFPGDGLLERDQLATAIQLGGYRYTRCGVLGDRGLRSASHIIRPVEALNTAQTATKRHQCM